MAEQPVKKTSGLAVAALICGICGLVFGWLGIGFLLSVLGIVFGGIGMSQVGKDPNLGGKGMAIAGLVCGIIGLVFWIILIAAFYSVIWIF